MLLQLFAKINPRFFLTGHHIIVVATSMIFLGLQRSWAQLVSCYLVAIFTEWWFYLQNPRRSERPWWDISFSAIAAASGLLLLVRSHGDWFYAPLAFLAIGCKYWFPNPFSRGHVFNPTNFAICMGLAFMPKEYLDLRADEYSCTLIIPIFTTFMGLAAVSLAGVWRVTLSYFAGWTVLSWLGAKLTDESFYYFWGPEVGAIGLIYMFLMISDPQSTPKGPWAQFLYGASIALILLIFRLFEIFFANFWALFIVCTVRGVFLYFKALLHESSHQQPKLT
jgi:hypothetical protein